MAISFKNLRSSSLNGPPAHPDPRRRRAWEDELRGRVSRRRLSVDGRRGDAAGIDLPSPGTAESWDDVTGFIGEIASEEHDLKTLIIDAVDGLEELVWRETCRRNKWNSIEDPGYGKGYIEAVPSGANCSTAATSFATTAQWGSC